MSDGSEQDQEAEVARQAKALRELGMPILRAVEEYIADTAGAEAESAARQVSETVSRGMAEVAAAVLKPKEEGWVKVGPHVIVGPNVAVEARAVLDADTITLSESASVLPLVDISELSAKVARDGIAGLSATQMFALVLIWLLTIGAPFMQQALPSEAQTLLNNEYGTVGLGIALTLMIVSRKH